ncbi:hypothetical protein AVEN_106738-1, partial [Araneus ventricosus]
MASAKTGSLTAFHDNCISSYADHALQVLDSYGMPESGILGGNLKWLGQYDECVGVQAPSKENTSVGGFRGKYCTLQVPLKLGPV